MPLATANIFTEPRSQDFYDQEPLLHIIRDGKGNVDEPCRMGVPFPFGFLLDPTGLFLSDPVGTVCRLQCEPLAHWPDGSIKWLLLDWVSKQPPSGESIWTLSRGKCGNSSSTGPSVSVHQTESTFHINTGSAIFRVDSRTPGLSEVSANGLELLSAQPTRFLFRDGGGKLLSPIVNHFGVEVDGPVRATLKWEGKFGSGNFCRFVARFSFFAGSNLVQVDFTLHNSGRAKHRGGLWDLGDDGSILFRELSLEVPTSHESTSYSLNPHDSSEFSTRDLEIFQASSGGENWQSRNHVERTGTIVLPFKGCRVRCSDKESFVMRPSPTVAIGNADQSIAAAMPEFWQQFPKSLEIKDGILRIGLYPGQWPTEHELQGGEQKTHSIWLNFGSAGEGTLSQLAWVHAPARVKLSNEWLMNSGTLPPWAFPANEDPRYTKLLTEASEGAESLISRREVIDEYGWRNYGDLYADHEAAYYSGPKPIISHYNNQYDVIWGTLLQWLRTGDARWWDIADPLARHVSDIDIYHTNEDKAAYNGGLFWHTDHYRDAGTCGHRAYSRINQSTGKSYGGGPCNEQNYTTGLLHYFYLTGNPSARNAVLSLANWVVAMDDGARNVLGLVDDGPTGTASSTTRPEYHGPGRGCGNSVNALLDAWLLTSDTHYLVKAEELIRRSIHPLDDIPALDLLNAELRWSYVIFLTVLARYLDLKADAGRLDETYAFARACLLHYAEWMIEKEAPYFDNSDKLEFPTETWPAQEMRKANVLRLAAVHFQEPSRTRALKRADELSERVWSDLLQFEKPGTTRALAVLFVEGLKDSYSWHGQVRTPPNLSPRTDVGPKQFKGQKARIKARSTSLSGLASACVCLLNPLRWRRVIHVSRRSW